VVSADSRGHSLKGEIAEYDKIQLLGKVAVAEAGLLLIRDGQGVRFDVHDWVEHATRSLKSYSMLTVTRELVKHADELKRLQTHPSVTKAERPQIILLVAERGAPVGRIIIDLRPFRVVSDSNPAGIVAIGLGPNHLSPEGPLYSRAKRRRPDLEHAERLSALADWCGLLLTVESELNPLVGGPIRQVIIDGAGVVRRRQLVSIEPSPSPSP
jgi:hypothetical protein